MPDLEPMHADIEVQRLQAVIPDADAGPAGASALPEPDEPPASA